ncbi:hypothetical protein EUTSA_v10025359mg [Eutrema salsugineum]|uniref:BHLH domain-containing protein n=2 Tax=Eutrema TaxID=98005 RepID=V4MGB6_EUTSA|nr:transcription factor bHLH68 [Eutrema salsugineum]ESQ54332.1 hypothetical protein EUTSA_v10025359mg [Eutrema salsugineum]BAJ33715.1 unnamed protein product [Eutrema halophilum]
MNRGVLESSPVQQLMTAGNPNWWNVSGGMRPPPPLIGHQQGPLPPQMTPNNNYLRPRMMPTLLPHFLPSPATSSSSSSSPSVPNNPNLSSWLESNDLPPESWSLSQLLLGGLMMGEEERLEMMNHHNHHDEQHHHHSFQGKMRLENWEEQVLSPQQISMGVVEIKQENNVNNNNGYLISSPNSPPNKSCVTTTTTTSLNSNDENNNNMLDFSSNHNGLNLSEGRHTPPDRTSECNSLEIGGSTNKKPRLQPSPSSQSTLKVRKEKLGGRIAALHQLVSPFGKTDTASVLSEAIGYIRFLQSQIEALSHPYFGTNASGNMRHQQHFQGDGSCIFPEDPGQLVNDQCMKRRGASSSSTDNQNANEEPKKDLRSRGLCLVPVSCTLQVGSDNGADYWAPALGSAGFH